MKEWSFELEQGTESDYGSANQCEVIVWQMLRQCGLDFLLQLLNVKTKVGKNEYGLLLD